MSIQALSTSIVKMEKCPHGFPMGSCPICNGMGGGGMRIRKDNNVRKPGEMSWMQCFMAGLRLRDKKLEALRLEQNQSLQVTLNKIQEKLSQLQNNLQTLMFKVNNTLPKPLAKLVRVVIQQIALPILKTMQKVLDKIQQIMPEIKQFVDNIKDAVKNVQEKLSSIFSEIFDKKEKNISKKIKKAVKKIFAWFLYEEEDDENYIKVEQEYREIAMKKIKDIFSDLSKNSDEIKENEYSTTTI